MISSRDEDGAFEKERNRRVVNLHSTHPSCRRGRDFASSLVGYCPSDRNELVIHHYSWLGFTRVAEEDGHGGSCKAEKAPMKGRSETLPVTHICRAWFNSESRADGANVLMIAYNEFRIERGSDDSI